MRAISARLSSLSVAERATIACVGNERADLVVAGCAILEGILDIWPVERLTVTGFLADGETQADKDLWRVWQVNGLDADSQLGFLGAVTGARCFVLVWGDPDDPDMPVLERARTVLRDRYKVATTVGIGPRFLHSTGQLHKGGPPTGVFVQLLPPDEVDVAIPGRPYGFAELKQAQAAGDLLSLKDRGLRAGRVDIHELLEATQ